jgi:hypothetical protein
MSDGWHVRLSMNLVLFNLVFLTVLFGVSPWLSVPMGLVAGAVAPFIGES